MIMVYCSANYVGPTVDGGGWSDGCLLLAAGYCDVPGSTCSNAPQSNMTEARSRSQFNLYSILAFNLFMTGNLSALSSWQIETWGNVEVIAVNQDYPYKPYTRLDQGAIGAGTIATDELAALRAPPGPPAACPAPKSVTPDAEILGQDLVGCMHNPKPVNTSEDPTGCSSTSTAWATNATLGFEGCRAACCANERCAGFSYQQVR